MPDKTGLIIHKKGILDLLVGKGGKPAFCAVADFINVASHLAQTRPRLSINLKSNKQDQGNNEPVSPTYACRRILHCRTTRIERAGAVPKALFTRLAAGFADGTSH